MNRKRELIEALVGLRVRAAAASLEISTDGVTTRLVLSGGRVVRVEDGAPAEPLGRLLVRQGNLKQEHYIDALERMAEAISVGERLRFGELAVQLGYVDADAVRRALTDQVRWRALRALSRPAPSFRIVEAEHGPMSGGVTLHVEELVLSSLRWVDDAEKRALILDELWHERVGQAWSWDDLETRFDFVVEESRFVRTALSGELTVEQALASPEASTVDGPAVLAALLLTGAAVSRVDSRETLARLFESQPPALAEKRDRGREVEPWELEEPGRVRDKLLRVREARASLPPRPLGDIEQRLRAEQAFQRGRALLNGDRPGEATKQFVKARSLDPTCPEYGVYAAWAEHRSSGKITLGAAREELVRLAEEAHARQPTLALPLFVLAEAAREEGDASKAEAIMRRVQKLEPAFHQRGGPLTRPSTPDEIEAGVREAMAEAAASRAVEIAHVAPPAAEAAPAAEAPSSPSLVTVTATPSLPPPRTRSPWRALVAVGAVAALAAGAFALRTQLVAPATTSRMTSPPATPTATPEPAPEPAPAPAVTPEPEPAVTPEPAPAATPEPAPAVTPAPAPAVTPAPAAESELPAVDGSSGLLLMSRAALGHRVFVDGKLVGDAKAAMRVACGDRRVKVGSHGREISLAVPCGGSVRVP